jgi:hypothetical protein
MDYAPFKIPSRMAGDFSYRSVIPPLRKKSRLLRLCPCKRGHDASASLPTFCGMHEGSNSLLKNTGDSFCLTFTYSNGRCSIQEKLGFSRAFLYNSEIFLLLQKVTANRSVHLESVGRYFATTHFLRMHPSKRHHLVTETHKVEKSIAERAVDFFILYVIIKKEYGCLFRRI